MNTTLDGFCDHTAMIADEELHQHYTESLNHPLTWNGHLIAFKGNTPE